MIFLSDKSCARPARLERYARPASGDRLAILRRIEQTEGIVKGNFGTVLKIQQTLEQAGICFTDDETGEIGVRLVKENR